MRPYKAESYFLFAKQPLFWHSTVLNVKLNEMWVQTAPDESVMVYLIMLVMGLSWAQFFFFVLLSVTNQ